MTTIAEIKQGTWEDIYELLDHVPTQEQKVILAFAQRSSHIYLGSAHGVPLCYWGLIPPTLLSDQAYLWMQVLPALKEHSFIFVRHSQRAIEEALWHYPRIVGHTKADGGRAHAWLKFLGAKFGPAQGDLIPFTIESKKWLLQLQSAL